jgi:glucans biosynthesis protein
MVAYWVPEQKIPPGQEFRFRYKIHADLTDPERPANALLRVHSTRLQPGKENRLRYVIDFTGGALDLAHAELAGKVQAAQGKIENVVTQRNEALGGWRLVFDLIPEGAKSIELRAWLQRGEQRCSETWVHHFGSQ